MPISPSDRALGNLLVGQRVITLPQLDEAVELAETWNVRLGDALLSRNWIDPRLYYKTYAQHFDLPFVDLIGEPPDRALLQPSETDLYVGRLTMPWRRRDGRMLIATAEPGPETLLFARQRWGSAIEFVVVSKFDIVVAVQQAFADALSHRAVFELAEVDPQMSARVVFTGGQLIVLYLLLTALLAGLGLAPLATLIVLNFAVSVLYLANFVLKGVLISVGGGRSVAADQAIAIEARALRDEELPVFTVLVPMFGEAKMLPQLAQALRDLDYPLGKLDIKIVLEAGDRETIEAARNLGLEGVFEIIIVPWSKPQTKPKACNFALRFARGEYLVIYDAEDRPEPDQLRKVVATFRRAPANTACLQCRLSYYNANENWLTRMFTLDYALWFDHVLPGLERLNIPIPLGGTSNHFRTDILRELHAWDPFNVTEDADLGIRIGQKGYRVGVVEFDHLRRIKLPRQPVDPATLALDQGLHADIAGPHAPAAAVPAQRRTARLPRLRPVHRRHCAGRPVQSARLGLLPGLARPAGHQPRQHLPADPAVLEPVQSARRQRRLHLSEHDRADPSRLARAGSLQPHVPRLLGAHLDRRLSGALAAAGQSALLGEDSARHIPASCGAIR